MLSEPPGYNKPSSSKQLQGLVPDQCLDKPGQTNRLQIDVAVDLKASTEHRKKRLHQDLDTSARCDREPRPAHFAHSFGDVVYI